MTSTRKGAACPRLPFPHVDTTRLHKLAAIIEPALFGEGQSAPADEAAPHNSPSHVIEVTSDGDEVRLGFLPTQTHPADLLLGHMAPDDCWGIGVATFGIVRPLAPDEGVAMFPPRTAADRGRDARVGLLHLVNRRGDSVSMMRRPGHEVEHLEHDPDLGPGRIDDYCRRALGLPTAPPPAPSLRLFASEWLDDVFAAALAGDLEGASWSDVARLHSAIHDNAPTLSSRDLGEAIDELSRTGRRYAAGRSWRRLLAEARNEPETEPRLLAKWLDEGSFARIALAMTADIDDTLADLDALLAPPVMDRIRRTLQGWALLVEDAA